MSKERFGNELHILYSTWLSITQRCRNPNHNSYKNYGALGIKLDEDIASFNDFVAYVESLPEYSKKETHGYTLDRIDGAKNYQKGNLRWASRTIQAINSRKRKTSKTTYLGIELNRSKKRWVARICWENVRINVGTFDTEIEALLARNAYILKHKLPHTIQNPIK
jgi:hypothetical protein